MTMRSMELDIKMLRAAVADLTKRVHDLETQRSTVAVTVGELRVVLEEGVSLCSRILALAKISIERNADRGSDADT